MSAEMLAERKEKKKRVDSNFKCIERLLFFFPPPCELCSDLMLWYFEPFSLSGFDSGNLGCLAAGVFCIMLLLASVCVIVVTTGPAKTSVLLCPRLSIISRKTLLLKDTCPHPGYHHNHKQTSVS